MPMCSLQSSGGVNVNAVKWVLQMRLLGKQEKEVFNTCIYRYPDRTYCVL